jgi:hypothetical protein
MKIARSIWIAGLCTALAAMLGAPAGAAPQ